MKMTNLDHFAGGVPAKVIFEMNIADLNRVIELCSAEKRTHEKALEVCFIALISYFEAFMKDHFASIINICPSLLDELRNNGQDVTINSSDLLLLKENHINRIGFILAEKYDFGTAGKTNSLYMALLKLSPFGKDQKDKFDRLLSDRNLIAHHGGIFTLSYSRQKLETKDIAHNMFMNSLIISSDYFFEALEEIKGLVEKTASATHQKLSEHIKKSKIPLTSERRKALKALTWCL
jgi:hypothetical protein